MLNPIRGLSRLLVATFLAVAPVYAQNDPTDGDEEEDIILMDTFRVDTSQDRGYTATNATSGTVLNSSLRDTAFAIDVFNEQFIRDTGSADIREVLAYDSGVTLDNTISLLSFGETGIENDARQIQDTDTDVNIRGFRVPTLKNGFFAQTRLDTVNVARIERAGGPSSLLYGIGAITGITNLITKAPSPTPTYEFELTVGNDDYYRATFDINPPAMFDDRFRFRTSGAWTTDGNHIDNYENETHFFTTIAEIQPFESMIFIAEFEYGTVSTDAAIGSEPRTGRDLDLPVGQNVEDTDQDGNSQLLAEGYGLGRTANLLSEDFHQNTRVRALRLEWRQSLGEYLSFQIAGHLEEEWIERFQITGEPIFERVSFVERDPLPFPAPSQPGEIQVPAAAQSTVPWDPSGTLYTLQYFPTQQWEQRDTKQFRANVVFQRDFWGEPQVFVFGRQELAEDAYLTDGNTSPLTNRARLPEQFVEVGNVQYAAPDGTPLRASREDAIGPFTLERSERWYIGHYAVYQGSFINGIFQPLLGYRWDRTATRLTLATYDDVDEPLGADRFDAPRSDFTDPLTSRGTTKNGYDNRGEPFTEEGATGGLTIRVTDWLSVYGNYSEGISLPDTAQRDGNGNGFGPLRSRSREIGAKFELWDGRVSGRFSRFMLEKQNDVRFSFYAMAPFRENYDPSQPIHYGFAFDVDIDPVTGRATSGTDATFFNQIDDDARLVFGRGFMEVFPDFENDGRNADEQRLFWEGNEEEITALMHYYQDLELAFGRVSNAPGRNGIDKLEIPFNSDGNRGDDFSNSPTEDRGAYHLFDEESEGYEVSLDLNLWEGFSQKLSYSYTRVTVSQGLAGLVRGDYEYTGTEAIFQALHRSNFEDPTDPTSYIGSLGSGVSNNDTPVHQFTYFGKYEFLEGLLRGVNVTFGARFTGERGSQPAWDSGEGNSQDLRSGVGQIRDLEARTLRTPFESYWLFDLGGGYERVFNDLTFAFRVNIRNVEDLREVTSQRADGTLQYAFLTPRDIRFSLSVRY